MNKIKSDWGRPKFTCEQGVIAVVGHKEGVTVSEVTSAVKRVITKIHITLPNGMQKSLDITDIDLDFIAGNSIIFVLNDSNQIVCIKNLNSNESITAQVKPEFAIFGFLLMISAIVGVYLMLQTTYFSQGLVTTIVSAALFYMVSSIHVKFVAAANRELLRVFNEKDISRIGVKPIS